MLLAPPELGWPILALDILQFPFDHPGLAFRVGQDIRQGEDTSPISGSSTRPVSHDVVVHKIKSIKFRGER